MPNRYTESLTETADVTASTTAANGVVLVNLGDASRSTGIDSGVSLWGIDGFLSRPADPTSAGAAQAYFVHDGNRRQIIGTRDRRFLANLPTLDQGDRLIFAPGGMSILMDDSEDEFVLTTAGGSVLRFSDDGLEVTLAGGASFSLTNSAAQTRIPTAPIMSTVTLDSTGFVVSVPNTTQQVNLDAGFWVTLGLNGGTLRPVIPNVDSVNVGPGAGLTLASTKVFAASV